MRILFIGCVKSSYIFLETLIKNKAEVVGVITKEKSDFNADFTDITPLCRANDIPYLYVKTTNDMSSAQFIRDLKPDIGFCLGWSLLVSGDIIDLFPMGMVGYHPAALPLNRGRHPLIWALALGLNETASSFFMIDKTADTGDIISQRPVTITYEDTAETLMDKVNSIGALQLTELVKEFEAGTVVKIPQAPDEGNSWRKRGKIDGQIDWRMSGKAIYDLVRALTRPYVGAHFVKDGTDYKVWAVKEIKTDRYKNIEPGKVIDVTEQGFVVKAWDSLIEVTDSDPIDIHAGDYL